jgi:uncharacterized iron-regulated membrane protein
VRAAFVLVHRWAGLAAGLLLALMGLTGSLMVWQAELDATLNPQWLSRPSGCAMPLQPIGAALQVLARHRPQARAATVVAPPVPGAAFVVWEPRDEATGWRREHFIDPACGTYLGARDRGAWRFDAAHAVPLLYELHSRLVAGEAGHTAIGVGGIVLLGLGLTGLVLSWPRGAAVAGWRRALSVKRGAAPVRWWFDLHRALGLWLLPVLLLLTATGTGLVFNEVTRTAVGAVLPVERLPRLPRPAAEAPDPPAPLPLDTLARRAEAAFPAARWSRVTLPAAPGAPIEVRLLQAGEPRADTGATRARMAPDGQLVARYDALRAPAGSTLLDWLFPLHSGEAIGLAARLLWCAFGLLPALWLGSGAWLWWRRQRATLSHRRRKEPACT